MKAISLLCLRVGTGLLLVLWGLIKVQAPDAAIGVSDKYYQSLLSSPAIQMPLGAAEIALGLLVAVGLFRFVAYPAQILVLGLGLAAIWQYILDPFGLYLLTEETRNPLFFPSLTVFAATLAVWAFKDEDALSLDRLLGRG